MSLGKHISLTPLIRRFNIKKIVHYNLFNEKKKGTNSF